MTDTAQIIEHGKEVLIGNYARLPVVMVRGQGSHLWDSEGKEYLDLFAGFGACVLGHCHPDLVAALNEQAGKLWQIGNTFYSTPQIHFADHLNRTAFNGQAFFCHSGLEANEAAVKLARLRGQLATPKRWKVVSMNKSFHGRSLAMVSATGNPAVKAGFEPMVPGFSQIDLGDAEALSAAVDPETAAVMIEPIQGEGGMNPVPADFAIELRRLCDERGVTLIFDEVWTGGGRTGKWFGHQYFTRPSGLGGPSNSAGSVVLPDIMTLGKAVGGGCPVGVMFARPDIAKLLVPGKHGCTLGGNPLCLAVAKTVFDVIERDKLVEHAATLGEYGMARLKNERTISSRIASIRGRGLMIGIELKDPPQRLVEKGLAQGVAINLTAKDVIRLAPPINISRQEWDTGLDRVVQTIAAL